MTKNQRWVRIAATITAQAGISVAADHTNYPGGVNYSITHRLPSGHIIGVIDQWWRKSHDVWIGYAVWIESPDSITQREWPLTKKRSDVVPAVREALALAEAA